MHRRAGSCIVTDVPPAGPSANNKLRVLVIDDEKNIRATLSLCLEQMNCEVTAAASAEGALAALAQSPYDLAFVDLRLGDTSGLDLLPKLLGEAPNLMVVVITAYGTIDNAVEAVKRGAMDYLPKPFTPAQIRHLVDKAAAERTLLWRISNLEGRLEEAAPEIDLDTDSARVRSTIEIAVKAAASDVLRTTPRANT